MIGGDPNPDSRGGHRERAPRPPSCQQQRFRHQWLCHPLESYHFQVARLQMSITSM